MGRLTPWTGSYADLRRAAFWALPRGLFDYVDGGAGREVTMRRNVDAFAAHVFEPRGAVWIPTPDTTRSVLSQTVALPVLTAPCGGMRLVHPDGDPGIARAAAEVGTVCIVSSASGYTLEHTATHGGGGRMWFQLYTMGSRRSMERLVRRADAAGYEALVVTIDTAVSGTRYRDRRHSFSLTLAPTVQNALRYGPQLVTRPRWTTRFIRDGMPFSLANTADTGVEAQTLTAMATVGEVPTSPTWDDIKWIRANWTRPLVVKGVLSADDARRARDEGAQGVVVSNHGGRQLDGAPATLEALPAIVDAVGSDLEVYMDSGVRCGNDVLAALALGARAVLVGRLAVWGLAAGGEPGVAKVLRSIQDEMVTTMRLLGIASVDDLGRQGAPGG